MVRIVRTSIKLVNRARQVTITRLNKPLRVIHQKEVVHTIPQDIDLDRASEDVSRQILDVVKGALQHDTKFKGQVQIELQHLLQIDNGSSTNGKDDSSSTSVNSTTSSVPSNQSSHTIHHGVNGGELAGASEVEKVKERTEEKVKSSTSRSTPDLIDVRFAIRNINVVERALRWSPFRSPIPSSLLDLPVVVLQDYLLGLVRTLDNDTTITDLIRMSLIGQILDSNEEVPYQLNFRTSKGKIRSFRDLNASTAEQLPKGASLVLIPSDFKFKSSKKEISSKVSTGEKIREVNKIDPAYDIDSVWYAIYHAYALLSSVEREAGGGDLVLITLSENMGKASSSSPVEAFALYVTECLRGLIHWSTGDISEKASAAVRASLRRLRASTIDKSSLEKQWSSLDHLRSMHPVFLDLICSYLECSVSLLVDPVFQSSHRNLRLLNGLVGGWNSTTQDKISLKVMVEYDSQGQPISYTALPPSFEGFWIRASRLPNPKTVAVNDRVVQGFVKRNYHFERQVFPVIPPHSTSDGTEFDSESAAEYARNRATSYGGRALDDCGDEDDDCGQDNMLKLGKEYEPVLKKFPELRNSSLHPIQGAFTGDPEKRNKYIRSFQSRKEVPLDKVGFEEARRKMRINEQDLYGKENSPGEHCKVVDPDMEFTINHSSDGISSVKLDAVRNVLLVESTTYPTSHLGQVFHHSVKEIEGANWNDQNHTARVLAYSNDDFNSHYRKSFKGFSLISEEDSAQDVTMNETAQDSSNADGSLEKDLQDVVMSELGSDSNNKVDGNSESISQDDVLIDTGYLSNELLLSTYRLWLDSCLSAVEPSLHRAEYLERVDPDHGYRQFCLHLESIIALRPRMIRFYQQSARYYFARWLKEKGKKDHFESVSDLNAGSPSLVGHLTDDETLCYLLVFLCHPSYLHPIRIDFAHFIGALSMFHLELGNYHHLMTVNPDDPKPRSAPPEVEMKNLKMWNLREEWNLWGESSSRHQDVLSSWLFSSREVVDLGPASLVEKRGILEIIQVKEMSSQVQNAAWKYLGLPNSSHLGNYQPQNARGSIVEDVVKVISRIGNLFILFWMEDHLEIRGPTSSFQDPDSIFYEPLFEAHEKLKARQASGLVEIPQEILNNPFCFTLLQRWYHLHPQRALHERQKAIDLMRWRFDLESEEEKELRLQKNSSVQRNKRDALSGDERKRSLENRLNDVLVRSSKALDAREEEKESTLQGAGKSRNKTTSSTSTSSPSVLTSSDSTRKTQSSTSRKLTSSSSSVKAKPQKGPAPKGSHQCETCSKPFPNEWALTRHVRTHTGEKSFKCEFAGCDKAFARQDNLTRHFKTHTGQNDHVCGDCGRAFDRKETLTKHLKTCKGGGNDNEDGNEEEGGKKRKRKGEDGAALKKKKRTDMIDSDEEIDC